MVLHFLDVFEIFGKVPQELLCENQYPTPVSGHLNLLVSASSREASGESVTHTAEIKSKNETREMNNEPNFSNHLKTQALNQNRGIKPNASSSESKSMQYV